MLSALADAALNRPRALLAGTLVALAVAAALAVGLADRIALAPSEATGSESAEVEEELGSRVGHDPAPGAVIVARGRERTPNSVSRVALDVIASQAEADPRVAEVGRGLESRPGRTTALEVYFDADEVGAQQQAIGDLKQGLDPGPLEVLIGGEGGVLHDARDGLWGKLGPLELLALPVALVVLALAFGPRLAAAPVIAAAGGLLGAVGVMGLVNELTPVSVLGVAPAAAVSLVLGIEACLVLTVRYRDGLATLGSPEEALRRTLDTAGRAVAVAAVAAAAVSASLAVVPVLDARSAALGGALAALLSGAGALAAISSILVLSGPEVALGRPGSRADEHGEERLWYRLESALLRWRGLAALLVLAPAVALLAVAMPGLRAETVPLDATGLSDGAEARRAEARAIAELGPGTTAPILVSAELEGRELKLLRSRLAALPGVASAEAATGDGAGSLRAAAEARPGSLGARDTVEAIRDASAAASASVGGSDAEALDADRVLFERLPVAAGVCVLLLAAFLFSALRPGTAAVRGAVSSLALAVASMLPAAAAGGLLVLTFQDGRLTGPLGYTSQGAAVLGAVVGAIAAVAAISALRSVAFAAAVAQERALGLEPPRVAVPLAASLTLPAAGAATLVVGAATVVLVGSDLATAKQLGLATASGLALVVLVRALLAPGLARLSQ